MYGAVHAKSHDGVRGESYTTVANNVSATPNSSSGPRQNSARMPEHSRGSSDRPCVVCAQPHRVFDCDTFKLVLVRYSIYRSIAILVNVRYRYLMVSRYFDISNDQTILGRYFVRSAVSSHSILKQPSIWKHCPKASISRYLLLIVRLSIHHTSILVSSIVKRFFCNFEVSSY